MDVALMIARLLHILGGIFWIGAMMFVTWFLAPAVAEAGADGAKVMGGIMKRKFMQIMPAVAVTTILSGLWLFWKVSSGFDGTYLKSGPGHAYATGGILALAAFIVGITLTRPAMMKAASLSQAAANASSDDRERMMAEAQRLRTRSVKVGKIVAWLLVLAAGTMAVGRYV